MHRTVLLGLALAVCLGADPPPTPERQRRHDVAVELESGARVEVVRVGDPSDEPLRSPGIQGYPVLSEPVVADPEVSRDLARVLRTDAHFGRKPESLRCAFAPGYALRLRTERNPALLVCFHCGEIEVDGERQMFGCAARSELIRLLQRALPDDEVLGKLECNPEGARVLRAIAAMRAASLETNIAQERKLVVDFADESPQVDIVLEPRFTRFLLEGAPESVTADLLAFYVAGVVEFDLAHPDQRADTLADVVPALEAVLPRYAQMRARSAHYRSAFLESAAAQQAAGTLREFVQSLAKEPLEESPATEGGPER